MNKRLINGEFSSPQNVAYRGQSGRPEGEGVQQGMVGIRVAECSQLLLWRIFTVASRVGNVNNIPFLTGEETESQVLTTCLKLDYC